MAILNEKNENTKKKIHLMITSLCYRNCKYCCNKQYDLNDIPYVTDEELKEAEVLYLTGGEPFIFSNPCEIARKYKMKYSNIKKIFVYTNARELEIYLNNYGDIYAIDGVTVSIKHCGDKDAFDYHIVNNKLINSLSSNMLYVFDNLYPKENGNFIIKDRVWQENFIPEPNSIFRKI